MKADGYIEFRGKLFPYAEFKIDGVIYKVATEDLWEILEPELMCKGDYEVEATIVDNQICYYVNSEAFKKCDRKTIKKMVFLDERIKKE